MEWLAGICTPQRIGCCEPKAAADKEGQPPESKPGHSRALDEGNPAQRVTQPERSRTLQSKSSKEEKVGIGIIVAMNSERCLYVHTVCPGATSEGRLIAGDILLKIDGNNVYKAPATRVADLLLGPPGSEVEIWVQRLLHFLG
mmetsp:Transcript_34211/g.107172  ORF Transcript_34211/g.107172 Transcript_34211/m.107172 type:complete len:143 (-) Transcript_34211:298-726(-)